MNFRWLPSARRKQRRQQLLRYRTRPQSLCRVPHLLPRRAVRSQIHRRAASVLGLGTKRYGESDYLVFYFDGKDLFLAEKIPLAGDPETQRGCLVDGWFYAFGASDFAVRQIFGK